MKKKKKKKDVRFEVDVVQRLIFFFPIKFKTFGFNTMINYQLFQKFKLLGYDKFNHLTTYF